MSKKVIKTITTEHAFISGNVESISTVTTEVADMQDLSEVENRLTEKIRRLEQELLLFREALKIYSDENCELKELLKRNFSAHVEAEKRQLYATYEEIVQKIINH